MRNRGAVAKAGDIAPVFAALGDPTRLGIVLRLCEGPQPLVRLTGCTSLSRQAVAKHLRALENAGIIRGQRVGRECIWALEPRRLAETRRYLDRISAQWENAIERLRSMVESGG